jgi:hypothetical protein
MVANRATLMVLACLLGLSAGCSGDDDDDIVGPVNTAMIAQDTGGGNETQGSFLIPAGTVVTSQSVSAPGGIAFSVGEVPANLLSMFTGTLLGSAAYLPLDCRFDRFIVIGIPVGEATGVANVYRYEAGAVSQGGAWQRLSTVNIRQGVAHYDEALDFGYYLAGREIPPIVEPEIPVAPTNLQASDGTHTDGIRLTWNPVFGASSYRIYRDAQEEPIVTVIGVSNWNDEYVAAQTASVSEVSDLEVHTYWVRAANIAGVSDFSASDTGYVGEHDGGGGGDV